MPFHPTAIAKRAVLLVAGVACLVVLTAGPASADGGAIERRTFLPYRSAPVDRVVPMEIESLHPAVPENLPAPPVVMGADGPAQGCGSDAGGWEAAEDRNLRAVFQDWASCAGWQVRWQSEHQFVLQASATFQGDFKQAASRLAGAFANAQPPLFAEFYAPNRILLLTTPTELGNQ